jgi:hypothetical protein
LFDVLTEREIQNVEQKEKMMEKVISRDGTILSTDAKSLAGRVSFTAAVLSLFSLAALHVLSPEFDPSWRMVSEYALGRFGPVLALMFLAQAVSSIALFFAIKSQIRTFGGKIGLFFLLAAGLGLTLAAIFDWTNPLHGLAAMIGIPSQAIASIVLSLSLSRGQPQAASRRPLLVTANLVWISLVVMQVFLFTGLARTGGEFGPEVLVGWPNRLLIVAYCAWLLTAASQSRRWTDQKS